MSRTTPEAGRWLPRKWVTVLVGSLLFAASAGCRSTDTTTQVKDGEKFPPASPPAEYLAERNRLRARTVPPSRP